MSGTPSLWHSIVNLPGAAIYEAGVPFESRPLVISRADQSHGYLSPRIQVSFPLSDRTSFRLSYAHEVQDPDFALVLLGVNLGGLGADLDFGKTISLRIRRPSRLQRRHGPRRGGLQP